MATKVEELLQEINDTLEDTANSLYPSRHRDFIGLDDVLEQLISAARAEGAEETKPKIAESTDRLIQWILDMMPPYEGANPEWGKKVLLDLVATAAEAERERIRKAADHYQAEDECFAAQLVDGNYVGASYEMYVVSPSLLAPAPKELT